MEIDYNNLFEGIKESGRQIKKEASNKTSTYSRILSFEKPEDPTVTNKYMLRFLPYVKEGKEGLKKTFWYYEKYYWKRNENDFKPFFVNVLSPKTFGKRCPISEYTYNIRIKGNDWEKEDLKRRLNRSVGRYCNVYVVHDSVNPENDGRVMVVSLNQTLWKKVDEALQGNLDDAWSALMTDANPKGEEVRVNVGSMITDLTENGVNFEVCVKNRGGFPEYGSSEFTRRDARSLKLSDERQKEILDSCIDVTTLEKELSYDEVMQIFRKEYLHLGTNEQSLSTKPPQTHQQEKPSKEEDPFDGDEIPGLEQSVKEEIKEEKFTQQTTNTEEEMDAFIKTLSGGNVAASKGVNLADTFNFN